MGFVLLVKKKILLVHPSVLSLNVVPPFFFSTSSTFIFFDMNLCSILHKVLAGKATRWLWIGGLGAVLIVRGQLDALLVHTLGLHPLD